MTWKQCAASLIEVGNPAPGAADDKQPPIICGLARATQRDIDKAWEAVQYAARPRIHTFLATSDIHLQYKLRMSRTEVLASRRQNRWLMPARLCEDVEFSPEDAGRVRSRIPV